MFSAQYFPNFFFSTFQREKKEPHLDDVNRILNVVWFSIFAGMSAVAAVAAKLNFGLALFGFGKFSKSNTIKSFSILLTVFVRPNKPKHKMNDNTSDIKLIK